MVKMHIRGDKIRATVGDTLMQNGWYGGNWVRFVAKRTVELATKTEYAGFILLGHKLRDLDASPYSYTDTSAGAIAVPYQYENKAVDAYGRTFLVAGGGDYDFNRHVYDTTKTYSYNEKLFVNDNAILTNVDSGAPPVGLVTATPQDNNTWLGLTLKF